MMAEKKITIDVDENGEIHAETFGMQGTECTEQVDKLMKDLATLVDRKKKPEYYKQGSEKTSYVKNGND